MLGQAVGMIFRKKTKTMLREYKLLHSSFLNIAIEQTKDVRYEIKHVILE